MTHNKQSDIRLADILENYAIQYHQLLQRPNIHNKEIAHNKMLEAKQSIQGLINQLVEQAVREARIDELKRIQDNYYRKWKFGDNIPPARVIITERLAELRSEELESKGE